MNGNGENSSSNQKNISIQILRGIAITLVLFHHAISRIGNGVILQGIDNIIICFHMPTFFIISGYLFQSKITNYQQKGRWQFIFGKIKHLMVPYVFWTVLLWGGVQSIYLIDNSFKSIMMGNGFAPMNIGELLLGLLTYETYYTEHLWFLYVLFLYFVVHCLWGELANKRWIPIGFLMGISTYFFNMPNIISRFMIWFVFFVLGRAIASSNDLQNFIECRSRQRVLSVILIFFICCTLRLMFESSNYGMNFYCYGVVKHLVKYTLGFDGVLLLYILTSFIRQHLNNTSKVLGIIGDYSYDIYLMHNPYIVALICTIGGGILGVNSVLTIVVAVLMGIMIPIIVSKFIIRRVNCLAVLMLGR